MSTPIELRVGLATGEAAEHEGDWYGRPVVEAARLCTKAQPGETLLTAVTRDVIGSRGSIPLTSAGMVVLKGLPGPVAAFRIGAADSRCRHAEAHAAAVCVGSPSQSCSPWGRLPSSSQPPARRALRASSSSQTNPRRRPPPRPPRRRRWRARSRRPARRGTRHGWSHGTARRTSPRATPPSPAPHSSCRWIAPTWPPAPCGCPSFAPLHSTAPAPASPTWSSPPARGVWRHPTYASCPNRSAWRSAARTTQRPPSPAPSSMTAARRGWPSRCSRPSPK